MNPKATLFTLLLLNVLIINATSSNWSGREHSSEDVDEVGRQNDENPADSNERNVCNVCLEREPDTIIGLCGHWFCRACIIRLQENQPYTCPLCGVQYCHEVPDASCAVCFDAVPDTMIGLCGHWFCSRCILRLQETQPYKCPFCRAQYRSQNPDDADWDNDVWYGPITLIHDERIIQTPEETQNHNPVPTTLNDDADWDNDVWYGPTTLIHDERLIQTPEELRATEVYLRRRLQFGYSLREVDIIVEYLRTINFDSHSQDRGLVSLLRTEIRSEFPRYRAEEIIGYLRQNEDLIRRIRERINLQVQREAQANERANTTATQQPDTPSRR